MATIESLAEVSVSRHEPSTHAQSVKNISVDKRIFFGIMSGMNNEKIRGALIAILGRLEVEDMEWLGLSAQEQLEVAALACFDANRNDEPAEVIRQARKELAE